MLTPQFSYDSNTNFFMDDHYAQQLQSTIIMNYQLQLKVGELRLLKILINSLIWLLLIRLRQNQILCLVHSDSVYVIQLFTLVKILQFVVQISSNLGLQLLKFKSTNNGFNFKLQALKIQFILDYH
ncbi:unnamed protein product [Paramecium pentaurelia]|uniref:Uncharacterized protein n=1 Tax=Paramecium pentaurelia TaxID=43138 RepID=A0A8S1V5X8_9CILI|nr:unnamed protein product [Paramecium pentaurelia]